MCVYIAPSESLLSSRLGKNSIGRHIACSASLKPCRQGERKDPTEQNAHKVL